MQKITKEEVFELAKKNGLNEEEAEKFLELLAKKSGGFVFDVLKLVAVKLGGTVGSVISTLLMAGEPTIKKMLDDVEVNL